MEKNYKRVGDMLRGRVNVTTNVRRKYRDVVRVRVRVRV